MRKLTLIMLLCIGLALTACGGSDNSSQVQTQQAQISALQGQLADVQAQLAAAQAQSKTDEAGINTAVASLSALQTSLSQLGTAGTATTAQKTVLKAASNQVLVLQALADSLTATGQQLAAACTEAKASIASLTSQLATANAQVTSLTAQLKTANDKVASLTAQLAASQGSSSDLSEQLATANAQITSLTSQLAAANGQVTTLTGQIATLTSANASLTAQLASATTTIATRDATIVTLNGQISTLQAQISSMVATPVPMSVSTLSAAVSTNITVTASFPASQAGKTATFSATGGTLAATSVTIAGDGTATTSFSSDATGTFNIYAVQGLYAGGVVVSITATPAATYSISGTIALNGAGLQNVIISLTGDATNAAITDASGNYSFAGVQNGNYTVTPKLSGYSFTPANISVTVSGANVTGQNFTDIITQTYSCSGTLSPLGRWCDNGNDGTVRDMTTGLLWLKDANCTATAANIHMINGKLVWANAQIWAAGLADGLCSLSDGSAAGDWRLPTKAELVGLADGTEYIRSSAMYKFTNVKPDAYWSSSTNAGYDADAWVVYMNNGFVRENFNKSISSYVWPVRGGQ